MKATKDVRKYVAELGIAEEEGLKKRMQANPITDIHVQA